MTMSRVGAHTFLVLLFSGLAGCGDGGIQEVNQQMEKVKQETKVSITPLSEPKKFTSFVYDAKGSIDPYNPKKLAIALAKLSANSKGIKPDVERRREPLEAYPLDALKMVGTLQKQGLTYAVVQSDKMVFQAKVGNHVGQNFGEITKITENEVEIKEIVQDASGDWVERKAKLELQETKK
jgi:type IV pilus assembly protein PilP